VAGRGQRGVAHVVVDVEAIVVDPHRMVLDRDPLDALAVARDAVQPRRDVLADLVDVDTALRRRERTLLEDEAARHVHVGVRAFELEEAAILRGEPVVGGHRSSRSPAEDDRRGSGGQPRAAVMKGAMALRLATVTALASLALARAAAGQNLLVNPDFDVVLQVDGWTENKVWSALDWEQDPASGSVLNQN